MAWAEKHGKGFRGRYYAQVDGRWVARTAGRADTKPKALKLARDQEAKIRLGEWFDPTVGKVTLAEYFDRQWYPNRGGELNTKAKYRSHFEAKRFGIRVSFGDMQLRHIQNSSVQGWVAGMIADGMTPVTIHGRFIALQVILAATKGASAMRDGLIIKNPCHGVQLPALVAKAPQIYTPDEVERILDHLDPWWLPIPLLDSETGLRWGELMGLQVRDFSPGFRSLKVHRVVLQLSLADTGNGTRFLLKEYPKEGGKKLKHLALSPEASTLVQSLVTSRRLGPYDHLLSMPNRIPPPEWHPPLLLEWEPERTDVWPNGLPICRNYFRQSIWKPAIAAAGVPPRKFHDLRASHISWLLAGGADLPAVMQRVGHSQFATTERYTAVMEDADTRTLDALSSVKARYRTS